MDMIDVVRYYRYRVDVEKDAYGCLLFALQLPSICSRIKKNAGFTEYAELKNDGGKYTEWLCEHRDSFGRYFKEISYNDEMWKKFRESIYHLRCTVVHEGVFVKINGESTNDYTFYFVKDVSGAIIGDCVFTSIPMFCSCFFDAALETFKDPKLNGYLDVTPYETMFFPNMVYNDLSTAIYDHYLSFWKEYSDDDKALNCIYDHLCSCKKGRRILDEMREHFYEHPNQLYKYRKSKTDNRDFNRDVCIMHGFDKWIVHEERYEADYIMKNLKVANFVLSYDDYKRMISIHDTFRKFVNEEPFSLTRSEVEEYLKKIL